MKVVVVVVGDALYHLYGAIARMRPRILTLKAVEWLLVLFKDSILREIRSCITQY